LHTNALPVAPAWRDTIAQFIAAQGMAFSVNTCKTRRSHLEHMARRMHRGPWSITADDIAGYFASHNWETETKRSRRNTIAAFYAWAVETGRTTADQVGELPRVKPSDPDPRPVPDRVYLAALAQADEDEAIWIDLAAEHGLRRAEIAGIHADDLVETLLGWDLIVHGKGGKTRVVPLTAAMARALCDRADAQRVAGYLFPGEEDGHVSARWLGTRVSRLLDGDWTIHKLRHRAATRFWLESGGDPYAVAELMGWANLSMVRTYVRLPSSRLRGIVEAASRMGAPLSR
jgi:integrase